MNSSSDYLEFQLIWNITDDNQPEFTDHLFRLADHSMICWNKIIVFFLFISLDFLRLIRCQSNEMIDLTHEDLYYSLSHQQFQSRYGPRSLNNYRKPYHLYNDDHLRST